MFDFRKSQFLSNRTYNGKELSKNTDSANRISEDKMSIFKENKFQRPYFLRILYFSFVIFDQYSYSHQSVIFNIPFQILILCFEHASTLLYNVNKSKRIAFKCILMHLDAQYILTNFTESKNINTLRNNQK